MAINLQKGQTIDLRKNDKGESVYDLSQVTIGLGWDVRQKQSGFLGKLFGGKEEEYDLDAIAFLLDSNGKVANLGRTVQAQNGRQVGLYEGDVIFFNSLRHPSGHIWLTGDNRTGAGDGDDEQIIVKLNQLDQRYQKILFVVSIYQGRQNNQHFGMVENAFIRAVDARGKEIAKYSLSGDATMNGKCSMVFSEVYRHNGEWKFRAIGEPHNTDNFVDILKNYTYQ
ncbi:TerD family protein [Myroides marinus]|uniref:TerD family protein n=1 Tax=Myroides marinus TaxID=703342 RepID=UPI002575E54D|nr:TerD family protein [Myroides marinus]MDM1371674.1 TerD family protein [Myroides marinus]